MTFNGAAADQPRRHVDLETVGKCFWAFNGAAADQPRRHDGLTYMEWLSPPFNGAAADQPRRPRLDEVCLGDADPSMVPRLISRGGQAETYWREQIMGLQWCRG